MELSEINEKLRNTGLLFKHKAVGTNKELYDIQSTTNIEGLYELAVVRTKDSSTNQLTRNFVWGQPLKVITVPIIVNNKGINYFLLVEQSRFNYSGKVSLEINKGFTNAGISVDDALLWNALISRKVPYLLDYCDIIKVVDLGYFDQHPDFCIFKMPFQLVFAKTKENFDISELKHNLKVKHDYYNEPKSGPPLHNTEPSLKSFDEINKRLSDIPIDPDRTKDEFYINDIFSITAIFMTMTYIQINGMPY